MFTPLSLSSPLRLRQSCGHFPVCGTSCGMSFLRVSIGDVISWRKEIGTIAIEHDRVVACNYHGKLQWHWDFLDLIELCVRRTRSSFWTRTIQGVHMWNKT